MIKIRLLILVLVLCKFCVAQQTVVNPTFNIPDTVCVNTPVIINNTTVGATNYYWNFCVAGINTTPTAVNLGNPGNLLSQPVFSDIVEDNGNYYVFVVDFLNSGITRLDFGTNMLNTPVATDLGNPSGALNSQYGKEGIQVVKNEGKWYAIIVGGWQQGNGSIPKIVKIEFGASINNNNPTGTDWGNLGNLLEPIDLHLFNDNGVWYGFTTNAESNTITRFNFTNSFDNVPTAVNMGNIGGLLDYPTGIYAINDNGFNRVFVCNGKGNSLVRLDFGTSLLNTPTGVALGNPNNVLYQPRDMTLLRLCGEIAGFAVNASNELIKLDFHNNLLSIPTGSSLGNVGNFNFPHSLSKFFRVGNDLYTLITNVSNNTITRLRFAGCTTTNIASSNLQNPPQVVYSVAGTYNINLTVDEGLPTQNSFCKQIVVMPAPNHTPLQTTIGCNIDSLKIGTGLKNLTYLWNTGASMDSIYIKNEGDYWIKSNTSYGCANTDSFTVRFDRFSVAASNDDAICMGKTIQLNASGSATSYSWSPATSLSNDTINNPVANPTVTTQYIVTGKGVNGCQLKDTVIITVNNAPIVTRTPDTTICHDKTIQLNASGGSTYVWTQDATLSNTSVANPIASPTGNKTYYVTVTNSNLCTSKDSIKISVTPAPVFTISADKITCKGTAIQLLAAGGDIYTWSPADGLNSTNVANPAAKPDASVLYTVNIKSSACNDAATLSTNVTVNPLPIVTASKSNDLDCAKPIAKLNATGATTYLWQPATAVSDSNTATTFSSTEISTTYTVKGTDANGCYNYDSVKVMVTKTGDLVVNIANAFSPNNDGYNDCFGISRYTGLLKNVDFSVYDRWGVRVFHTHDTQNCWDGRYKGTVQNAGGFVYVLKASTFCGEIFKKGIVMLVK